MASVRVVDVTSDAGDRVAFHAVADTVYRGSPAGTAPLPASIDRNLERKAFASRQRLFVAFRYEAPVGRIVARVSPALGDAAGTPYGLLGFFECVEDGDAAAALFDAGTQWLRAQAVGRILGPLDGDTWHRYRVNVGPFARPPFPLEPWNPPYYATLWEQNGFTAIESYSSKWIDDVQTLLPGLQNGLTRSRERGIRIRGLHRDRIHEELVVVHELSTAIFRDAFLYSPISREEFLALYAGFERFLDPQLVLFAETSDGTPVGFVFAYADPKLPAVHYKTIGVLAEWRRAAVAAALSHHVYSSALRQGRPQGNHALMRDDNRSQALDQGLGDVFRRYVLYELVSR